MLGLGLVEFLMGVGEHSLFASLESQDMLGRNGVHNGMFSNVWLSSTAMSYEH